MIKVMSFREAKAHVRKYSRVVPESVRQFPPNSYVEVVYTPPSGTISYKASAVVTLYYLDKWDAELGLKIAVGMATATLARRLRAWTIRQKKKELLSERHVVEISIPPDKVSVTIAGV